MKEPYVEAAKVDKIINKLIAKYPISDFSMEWWKFARTVKTGLSMIEEVAASEAKKKEIK